MKQTLQLRVSQHLALTPQLQQSIRLLQLSTLELHQELEQILSDNPLLERLDDPLDHSVRLLADGSVSSAPTTTASSDAPAPDAAPAGDGETSFEGGEGGDSGESSGDSDWSFDDVARTSKAPEDDDARPQMEAHDVTLREHLLEQMRVTVQEPARPGAGRTGGRCARRQWLPDRAAGGNPCAPARGTRSRGRGNVDGAEAAAELRPARRRRARCGRMPVPADPPHAAHPAGHAPDRAGHRGKASAAVRPARLQQAQEGARLRRRRPARGAGGDPPVQSAPGRRVRQRRVRLRGAGRDRQAQPGPAGRWCSTTT